MLQFQHVTNGYVIELNKIVMRIEPTTIDSKVLTIWPDVFVVMNHCRC